jgi:hypothetical protein
MARQGGKMQEVWIIPYALFDLKNAEIRIEDGTTPANSIVIKIGEGTVSWTERKERRYILNRGVLDDVRNEDEAPLEVNLGFKWEYIKGTTGSDGVPTIVDALKNINAASTWVSTDDDACRPYAVNLVIDYTPVPAVCGDAELITIPDFRYEQIDFDIRTPENVTITGHANVTEPVIVRSAQS